MDSGRIFEFRANCPPIHAKNAQNDNIQNNSCEVVYISENIKPEDISINGNGTLNLSKFIEKYEPSEGIYLLQVFYTIQYSYYCSNKDTIRSEIIKEEFKIISEIFFRMFLMRIILCTIDYYCEKNDNGTTIVQICKAVDNYNEYASACFCDELTIKYDKKTIDSDECRKRIHKSIVSIVDRVFKDICLCPHLSLICQYNISWKKCCDDTYNKFKSKLKSSCFAMCQKEDKVYFSISGLDGYDKNSSIKKKITDDIYKYLKQIYKLKTVKNCPVTKRVSYFFGTNNGEKILFEHYWERLNLVERENNARMFSCCERKLYGLCTGKNEKYIIYTAFPACTLCKRVFSRKKNVKFCTTSDTHHKDLNDATLKKYDELARKIKQEKEENR